MKWDKMFLDNWMSALSSYGHGPGQVYLDYDVNGNMISHNSDGSVTSAFSKHMYWNTNNLMKGIKVDDYLIQHYMYLSLIHI